MARTPSERELAGILIGHGIVDFITGGRLTKIERNALWKVLKKLGPPVVTTTGRLAGTAAMGALRAAPAVASTARFVTMRHPYTTAAVVTYEVIKNREQIAQLAREGWEVVEPFVEPAAQFLMEGGAIGVQAGLSGRRGPAVGFRIPKKRPSKFNSAIKAGMAAVKKSKSYGGKGKIKPATTVFSMVTKLASAKKKKKKAPKSGIRRLIWNAMKGLR